ncbi:MAG: 16S rRNA (guanine(527)-N(7))-methyltransferase RsmG [Phycisphaerales bacterium]|nr:16S rRNA (guanine(527)-N(7))-methyltransferase RsmG [Phycisphaerales bacterium]
MSETFRKRTGPIVFPGGLAPLPPPPSFLAHCEAYGISFEANELNLLGRFLALLLAGNDVVNLTAIREPDAAWEKHIFDGLTLLPLVQEAIDQAGGKRIELADVGSGGGVPGIPLAIVTPRMNVTLIESTNKKGRFLLHVVGELNLPNVRVLSERVEDLAHDRSQREHYDLVTARALGRVAVASELTVPLAKAPSEPKNPEEEVVPGGRILLVKGEKAAEELAEAKQALHLLHAVHAGTVDTPTGKIVVLEKARRTPRMYPRRAGDPARSPLK